ncbi:MAG: hypothetical protein M1839_009438 [Geoglossum umbratile]|nr:MAG: hypothetical protein M1839_009438 [Geoglossum umbratile]
MEDTSIHRDSAPACNTCQARKRKCDGVLPKCTNCFTHDLCCSYDFAPGASNDNALKVLGQPTQIMDEVRISMDGLTKAENLRVRRLPLGFSMYLTSETERLVRELPEEIWADVVIPEEGKGYIKTILAARPDIPPRPYSDPILEHNSAFNWKSLFPPECDLPESVSGAVGDVMEERTETQEELQLQGTSEQEYILGLEQVTSTVDESHLEPVQFELPTIYQTEEFTDSWEDAYGWLRNAMACEPFSIGHTHAGGYQLDEDVLIAEPHI